MVSGTDDLRRTLDSLGAKHLVLIDTVGMGQRDARIAEHAMLLAQPEVKRLLLLNATAQAETLDEVVGAYRPAPGGDCDSFAGCIITKLDEAARIGDVLDVVIRHRMPVHFLSTGQRVPEDLHAPNVPYLVHRALRLAAAAGAHVLAEDEVGLVVGASMGAAHA
jgi:flagellar biosynthesis protein FlhF